MIFLNYVKGKDTSDQPEKYLYTPLAHKINETIIPKYMAELVRQKVVVKNEVEVNLSSVEISKSAKNESAAKQVDKANTTTKTSQKVYFLLHDFIAFCTILSVLKNL